MEKVDLQCLLIGRKPNLYANLVDMLNHFDLRIRVNETKADKKYITHALKKIRGAGLVFISDEIPFPLTQLSDLIWQYAPDVMVVILTEKRASVSFEKTLNNAHFSRLNFKMNSSETRLFLGHLIQTARLKQEFRHCKHLLGLSEKRCQWLVDSSREAVAYISRDLHLYSNNAYLGLFDIESIQELHSTPVRELIVENEYPVFEEFVKKQLRKHKNSQSLVVSMRKKNGALMRSSIVAIPSVFKGRKCLQLWVHPLEKYNEDKVKSDDVNAIPEQALISESKEEDKEEINPFERLTKSKETQKKPQRVSSSLILKEIIKRKEASIIVDKLLDMKKGSRSSKLFKAHHLLELRVPVAQREGVNDLLFNSVQDETQSKKEIFWDKVKFSRLIQILMKKKTVNVNFYISLSDSSVSTPQFSQWLAPGLLKLGKKASNLTFLIPSQLDEKQRKEAVKIVKKLRKLNSKIALDDFTVSKSSLSMLRHVKPDYVRLSLPWVRLIEGNHSREISLGRLVRQFEEKNIKVIAPCCLSSEMRRLFTLSGVSFCQERVIKTG